MDCIFCKIISGDIPSYTVYEDEHSLAILDIAPVSYGHVLVIPKQHAQNFEEISEETLSHVYATVKKVGKSLKEKLGVEGYNANVNNDPVAGQVIPHLHVHIIPRKSGDGLELWSGGSYADGEAEEILNILK